MTSTPETQPELTPCLDHDGMLSIIVSIVNDSDTSLGITLAVAGGPVTGTLISFKEWLELSEAQMVKAGSGGWFTPYSEREAERLGKVDGEGEGSDSADEPGPFHIHLKGARYFDNGMVPSVDTDGFLWRGRISQVSAWSMGEVGRKPS